MTYLWHCVVCLGKTVYPLIITGSTKEDSQGKMSRHG